jgi:hypothetical protein
MKVTKLSSIGAVGLLALLLLTPSAQIKAAAASNGTKAAAAIDAKGDLHVPIGYRTSYEFLGSWAVATAPNMPPRETHVVYASPGTIEAYLKDKRFPDGSVLVKEVLEASTEKMTTGIVSRAQKLKGWFVMVKESKDTHPENALWGDGWAWAWFNPSDPSKTTSMDYRVNCITCHLPAKSTDWIYVQGYPPLKATQ